ncbi:apoptosis regulatory protein siva-like protein [Lasius niger]|uniref:Apoptosis regulatory protein siva-like protein n=1 Tax=Lasius niger TaxID=67767 RepID=A0A0J7L7J1_LASNI|nr:apoptosis regulatory protein siva-like protein [Lasius niger]
MPKRPCPFEADLLPQLKVHVGQKQMDNGVSRDERMKDVYDKTLTLLKTGARTLSYKLNASAQMDPVDLPALRQVLPYLIMDEAIKKEPETIQYVPKIQPDDANDDVFLPNTSNSTNPENEALPRCESKVQIEERYVPENKAYEQDEADKILMDREIISKRITRKSSRLSLLNNKKENLKRTISSKVIKQKRTARKSNKTAQSPINEMLTVLGKKFETESYEKSFRYIQPNNATNALQYIPYGIPYGKQEESHYNYSSNTNRNMLQYLDCNNLRQENLKQPILINSNPWSIVPKSGQNFVLNNISNVQNQVGQAGYYNAYTAADYNSKQERVCHV